MTSCPSRFAGMSVADSKEKPSSPMAVAMRLIHQGEEHSRDVPFFLQNAGGFTESTNHSTSAFASSSKSLLALLRPHQRISNGAHHADTSFRATR